MKHPLTQERKGSSPIAHSLNELQFVHFSDLRSHLNKLPTTPDDTNGEHRFTMTHPFHPLFGQTFPLLSQRFAWGEERVFFADPQTHEVRSLAMAWTSLALPDPFLVVAGGKAVLRFVDVQHLNQMLRFIQAHRQEDH